MTKSNSRPISPHLSIYKPQISSVLSIMHRITGIILFVGIFGLAWFVILLLNENIGFYLIDLDLIAIVNSWWFKGVLLGILFCLYYHLLNGVRHLIWDIGFGFELSVMRKTGWFVVLCTIFMTMFTLYLMLS